jgi:hypothetical protein
VRRARLSHRERNVPDRLAQASALQTVPRPRTPDHSAFDKKPARFTPGRFPFEDKRNQSDSRSTRAIPDKVGSVSGK